MTASPPTTVPTGAPWRTLTTRACCLAAVGALSPGVADAVVSLCRLGAAQVPLQGLDPQDHLEVWLVDDEDANNDLAHVLRDAAAAVHQLRSEGKRVLLHCVHGHTRTPVVAALYGTLRTEESTHTSLDRVLAVIPSAMPRSSIVSALHALDEQFPGACAASNLDRTILPATVSTRRTLQSALPRDTEGTKQGSTPS